MEPVRHVLVCCAHSDDCVIMAGEYAYAAILDGLTVHIIYLTCSGPDPTAEISQLRRKEAITAWSSVGVPENNLTFIDLPQAAAVEGQLTYSDDEMARAKGVIQSKILILPPQAAVCIGIDGHHAAISQRGKSRHRHVSK